MLAAYPSLTREGYVRDPARAATRIMAAALASDANQDPIHGAGVTSIQYVISMNATDEMKLQTGVQNSLEALFGKYFQLARFDVDIEDMVDSPGRKNIKVKGLLMSDGVKYTLARMLMVKDNVIADIKEITYT